MNNFVDRFCVKMETKYGISYDELKLICNSPFKFLKRSMTNGMMISLRFVYFGVFRVSNPRVKYNKRAIEEGFKNGTISEKVYNKKMETFNNYKENERKNKH